MKNKKGVISVSSKHIDAGIEKYKGEIHLHLQAVIKSAGFDYTPYALNDGRILLVLPNKTCAFLYDNEELLTESLSLES